LLYIARADESNNTLNNKCKFSPMM